MTTIACDGKVMAADSRQVGSYIHPVDCKKIFKFKNYVIGFAGELDAIKQFLDWFKLGADEKQWSISENAQVEALVSDGSGDLYHYCTSPTPVYCGRMAAIGSGGDFAMAAMLAGANARRAVSIAAELDINTGGKIITRKI